MKLENDCWAENGKFRIGHRVRCSGRIVYSGTDHRVIYVLASDCAEHCVNGNDDKLNTVFFEVKL